MLVVVMLLMALEVCDFGWAFDAFVLGLRILAAILLMVLEMFVILTFDDLLWILMLSVAMLVMLLDVCDFGWTFDDFVWSVMILAAMLLMVLELFVIVVGLLMFCFGC